MGLGWRKLEEAEAVGCVGVSVDHDVAGVLLLSDPLPGVVAVWCPVKVLVDLLLGRTDDYQVSLEYPAHCPFPVAEYGYSSPDPPTSR